MDNMHLFSQLTYKMGRTSNYLQEVIVIYVYEKNHRKAHRYLSFKKIKEYDDVDYIELAIERIKEEIKSGYLEQYSDEYFFEKVKKPNLLAILAISCLVISIIFISLFVWKR